VPSRWRVLAGLLQSTERKAIISGNVRSHLDYCRNAVIHRPLSVAVLGRRIWKC